MEAPNGPWRMISEESRPGPVHMALDETATETVRSGGLWTVRVYRWEPSCVTMGYRQDPATIDWGYCNTAGIDVTRRQTGGGGIYHDEYGDIAYSIVLPADVVPGNLVDCYHALCEPIVEVFAQLGVDADYVEEPAPPLYRPACYLRGLHPAHDIVAGPDGRKIAGNAQYRRNDVVVQHGSLTYSAVTDRHLGVFTNPGVTPERFHERVVGIEELVDVERSTVVDTLETTLSEWAGAREGSWTDTELELTRERTAEKYGSASWVHTQPGDRQSSTSERVTTD